jgi:hypothetical protein
MKKSDLKLEIKKYITEILSEDVNEELYREKKSSQQRDTQNKNPDIITLDPNKDKKTINDSGFKNTYEKANESKNLKDDDNKSAILKKLRGE